MQTGGIVGSGSWNGRGLPFLQQSGLFHVEQIPRSSRAAAAGFEFFSGAAGAGIIATDFGEFALEGKFELGCGRLVGGGGGGLTGRRGFGIQVLLGPGEEGGKVGEQGFEGLEIRGAAEEIVQDFAFDGVHEVHKHGVGVVFVFDEGVFLAEGAEVDGFAESVHGVEVFLPEAVDGVEDDVALKAFEGFGMLEFRLALVGGGDGFHEELGVFFDGSCGEGGFFLGEGEGEGGVDPMEEAIVIGLLAFHGFKKRGGFFGNHLADDFGDEFARVGGVHDLVAVAVDDFALLVHDIIKLQSPLADHVVPLFDAFLGGFDAAVEPGVLEFFAFLEAEGFHDLGHAVAGAEVSHEVVLEADIKAGAAGISLAGATATELAVDAARLVALGAKDEKPANFGNAFAEFDVGAATGHVGGNGDSALESSPGNDLGFLDMKFGVEDGVGDFLEFEHSAQQLGGFHAGGADEDGLAGGVDFFNGLDGGVVFFAARFVDAVVLIAALDRAIGGDHIDIQSVNIMELADLGLCGAGHAGEFVVEPEVILDRDGGEGLGFAVDLDALLGLDGLVETIGPAATGHFAAREGIDNDNLIFLNDIFNILLIKAVGFDELGDIVNALGLCVAMLLALGFFGGFICRRNRRIIFDVCEFR